MSRRLRIEDEKARQLKDELQEEEDKLKLLQKKIFGPLVWRRYENGVKIQDLQENLFHGAVDLILVKKCFDYLHEKDDRVEHFTKEDVLFRNTRFAEDELSKKSFAERIIFKLNDRASIIAVDEANGKCIAGVLILNPVNKCDFGRVYSRTMLVEGRPYKSIIEFLNHVNRKVDVFQLFRCEIYLRYYLICVHPDYRSQGLGFQLMLVGLDIARHLKIPVAMGVFTDYKMQRIARKIGMDQILLEYKYVKWADKHGELQFCDPGAGNYTCNIQAGLVPPAPEPETLSETEDANLNARVTRADKKKEKAKADAKNKT